MKWLFFLLLLINIGLFVWIYPQINKPEPESPRASDKQSLLLLDEVEKVETDPAEEAVAVREAQPQVEPEMVIETSTEQALQLTNVLPEQNILEAEEPDVQAPTPNDDNEDKEIKTAATESLMEEQPAAAQTEQVSEPLHEPELEIQPPLHCNRLGPLAKRNQADQLSLRLRTFGLQPDLNSELSNEQEGYWVLVPPQKSRAVAVRIVQRLKQAGVTDLWRFTSGELAHAISLGLFRNESRAELRRKSIEEKGFDAEVRPRYRQKTEYWLSYNYFGDSPISDDQWKVLEERYPGIVQRTVDCQEIASQ